MTSETYETLNKAWKQTCKILLGEEMGELKSYEDWLWKYSKPEMMHRKSGRGKDVFTYVHDYCRDARFVSLDEIDFGKKQEPLNINEIKDIDSIVEAIEERFAYAGNIVLGNSKDVERSSDIHNSFHILDCGSTYECEYGAYSYSLNMNMKYAFGCSMVGGGSQFMVRCCNSTASSRCLESWNALFSSDIYFSFNCENVQNALFSFNLKNRRNAIGNIELPRDKFAELKAKLLAEIREKLKRDKSLPGITDILSGNGRKPDVDASVFEAKDEEGDIRLIEEAFSETTGIILGKRLVGIDNYGKWLGRNIYPVEILKSTVTRRKTYHGMLALPFADMPKDRLVKESEAWKLGEMLKMDEKDIVSLERIMDSLWKIAFFTSEVRLKVNKNVIDVVCAYGSVNCYNGVKFVITENAALSFLPRSSKYIFGSNMAMSSSFAIRSHYSSGISRGFEVDSCSGCSDIYYSHNCENVHDSMFCFNVKNLRNAIGNGVLPIEKYNAVKKSLLEQIVTELETKKTLRWDIYNIGCAK